MTVTVTKLPNGLTVASDAMAEVETCSLGLWVGVGARHESAKINGVAHLLEHMVFKGTGRRSARAIAEEIEAVGGHLNAYTGRETTAFYAKVLAEDAPLALDIVADMLLHPRLDAGELERERQVVLQEIGQAVDTPDDIIFDDFQLAAYPDQGLGRPVLGTPETVGGLSAEDLRGYLTGSYAADSSVLVAAGRIEHDRLHRLAEELFGDLPARTAATLEPARYLGGEHRQTRDLEQAHLLIGFDSVGFQDSDYYAVSALSTLLGGGMSSRLFQEVREERGLVYSIYSFLSAASDSGLFGVYAGTGAGEAQEVLDTVCRELERSAADITSEEVDRAKAQLKAAILMSRERTGARAEQLAGHLLVFDREVPVAEIVAELDVLDAARLRRCAAALLESKPTLALLGPVAELTPYETFAARFGGAAAAAQ
ncbi:M16 family metallopeptidase [Algihabitans albus]|uniref:M16 family metallopeptidase n=1 Tax=Algihabitans albus TaxID=2164067 RepID=UPI000E5CFC3B|nr:pitrilysin family protein [Algihabitans albus]